MTKAIYLKGPQFFFSLDWVKIFKSSLCKQLLVNSQNFWPREISLPVNSHWSNYSLISQCGIPCSYECVLCFSPRRPKEGAVSYPHLHCRHVIQHFCYLVLAFTCLYSPSLHFLVMSWIVLGEELHRPMVRTSLVSPLPTITVHNACTWNSTYLSFHNPYLNNMIFKSNFLYESHGCSSKVCWSHL